LAKGELGGPGNGICCIRRGGGGLKGDWGENWEVLEIEFVAF